MQHVTGMTDLYMP